MNPFHPSSLVADREVAQARFARQIVARLDEDAERVGGDVAERLRFARERALARAQLVRSPTSAAPTPKVGITAAGAALLGGGWWVKLASIAPLVALVCGLVVIQKLQTTAQISVAAEVDAALLADDLPPNAYSDAGFVEFLKSPPRE